MRKKLVILGIDHGHYRKIIEAAEKHDDIELTAIAHETDDSAAEVAEKHRVRLYDSYEECLDRERPDIAGIAMFNGARGQWIVQCLERKIAIIADKPICTNMKDIARIEETLKDNKTFLSMMLTCRCDPRFVAIRREVKAGAIGDVLSVDAVRYHALNRPGRPDWMFSENSYGGPGLDILIHDYDLARWITGIEWNKLDMREIRTGRYDDEDFKDLAFLNSVDHDRILNLKMLWHSPDKHWDRFTVYGTKGVVELPFASKHPLLINDKGQIESINITEINPFAEQFFEAYLNNNENAMPILKRDVINTCKNILISRRN